MNIKFLPISGLGLALSCILFSCQKNVEPVSPDSIKSVLPKQIIWQNYYGVSEIKVISLQYDTLNRKINLYFDDTTNTNPYDYLAISYTYNKNGYLIRATGFDGDGPDFADAIFDINRNSDDKINYIAKDEAYVGKDTTFYSYQTSNGNNIRTIFYNRDDPFFNDTTVYLFDNDFDLISIDHSKSEFFSFEYNADKSLKTIAANKISSHGNEFFYQAGNTDKKEDLFLKLLIGRDYYLPDLKKLFPFQFAGGNMYSYGSVFGIYATNPYHIVRATNKVPDFGIDDVATLSYEYNERQLLSKVTYNSTSESEQMAIFKY